MGKQKNIKKTQHQTCKYCQQVYILPKLHTPGALEAAEIIMNGKRRIWTEYGEKSLEGIADLIERKTAAPELLEACKCLLADLEGAIELFDGNVDDCWHQSVNEAKQAIAKAEPKERR